jgi:heme-degrading monooxygenase HmoA
MYVVRIEHRVADFATWKAAFDSDPVGRAQGGVRRHRVLRARNDPNHVAIDLEFGDAEQAQAFLDRLRTLWARVEREGLITGPRAEVYEEVETQEPAT